MLSMQVRYDTHPSRHRKAAAMTVATTTRPTATAEEPPALTDREYEILSAICAGMSGTETARELGLADETIKTHLARIYRKLGAVDRAHAIAIVFRDGLVAIDTVVTPIAYTVTPARTAGRPDAHLYTVTVAATGHSAWVVRHRDLTLGADGAWDKIPTGPDRTEAWLAAHRFGFAEALRRAKLAAPRIPAAEAA